MVKSERGQFRRLQKAFKDNWLSYQLPLRYCKTFVNIMIPIHMFTKADIFMKIDPVFAEIFGAIRQFCAVLCQGVAQISIFDLVTSEVTGWDVHHIFYSRRGISAAVNACILRSNCNSCWNDTAMSKRGQCTNVCKRFPQLTGYHSNVPWAISK